MLAPGRPSLGLALSALVACASGRPTPAPSPDDGVREAPLTAEEVGERVAREGPRLRNCYKLHRLSYGLQPLSDFRVRLRIPPDGSPHVAEIAEATQAGQEELERCVIETMEAIRFPAHRGDRLLVDVPIRAPER